MTTKKKFLSSSFLLTYAWNSFIIHATRNIIINTKGDKFVFTLRISEILVGKSSRDLKLMSKKHTSMITCCLTSSSCSYNVLWRSSSSSCNEGDGKDLNDTSGGGGGNRERKNEYISKRRLQPGGYIQLPAFLSQHPCI